VGHNRLTSDRPIDMPLGFGDPTADIAIPVAPKILFVAEIAKAEKISDSYVGRILRLTLPAPDIVEAIVRAS
jgi:hypothetical protein